MRRTFAALALAAATLGGCSRADEQPAAESAERTTAIDIRDGGRQAPAMAPPGIDVTAAPGVAFSYRYAFVLPDSVISAVQEQHASACEKLGPARCRITGMRYTLVDEDEVRGELRFKLDPALARSFGKEGIAAVEKAQGRLVDAAIDGQDVGSEIARSRQRSQQNAGELARIEQRLATSGLGDAERQALREQADRLRQEQAREQQGRGEGEAALADTPMTFAYAGDSGFTLGGDSIGRAWDATRSSFTTMVWFILLLFGTLLPWALLIGLLVALWRGTPLSRLGFRRKRPAEPNPPAG